jgi:diguanylate cyclase (GGDEF)-like protein/PAS domain S-box-containing protein
MYPWEWELPDDRLRWLVDPQPMLGPRPPDGFPDFRDMVHPEDLDALRRAWRGVVAGERPHYEARFRLLGTDGEWRWLAASGHLVRGESGEPSRLVGVTLNLTAGVEAAKSLRASETRFRHLTLLSSDWYWEQDEQSRFTFVSGGAREPSGMPPGYLLGRCLWDLAALDTSPPDWDAHRALLAARLPFHDLEIERAGPDGGSNWVSVSGVPVFDAAGVFTGYRGIGRNITARKHGERMLAQSAARFRSLLELSSDWYWEQDEELRFTVATVKPGARHTYDFEGFIGLRRWEIPGLVPLSGSWARHQGDLAARRPFDSLILRRETTSGEIRYYFAAGEPVYDEERRFRGYRGIGRDVTAEFTTRKALEESEQRFRDVIDASGEYVWEVDGEGHLTFASQRVEKVLGYAPEEMIGWTATRLMPAGEVDRVRDWLAIHRRPDGSYRNLEHRAVTRDGRTIWLLVSGRPILDHGGAVVGYRGTGADITDSKLASERIEFLATRDTLTGLPNRVLLEDRVEHAIGRQRRENGRLALLFLDLDRFKNINDSLGHQFGDELLKAVAERIREVVRESDTIARLGGDEFVVLLEQVEAPTDAAQVAQKLIATLGRPLDIGGNLVQTTTSIGIGVFPDDGEDFNELLKHADAAMYHAKDQGRNTYQFFTAALNERVARRVELEFDLRRAIERREFRLAYQPVVGGDRQLLGLEALLRWEHPVRGLVAPMEFIPLAEETSLIVPIGEWAIGEAVRQIYRWRRAGLPTLPVAINVSPRQLTQAHRFAATLQKEVRAYGVDPSLLSLEITETAMMSDLDHSAQMLRELVNQGFRVLVDDFGAGHSSLKYLSRLPIATLKIDRSFVKDVGSDVHDEAIVRTIIAMAKTLGLKTIAEGVETVEQFERLREWGTDAFQGFFFSRPLFADDLAARFLVAPG